MKYDKIPDLNRQYIDFIKENFEENRNTAAQALSYIECSSARYHGQPVYSLYMPKLITEETADYFRKITESIYSIFNKVIRNYLDDPAYRALFGFEPELEELILVPSGYDCLIPISRVDIFLNEEDLSFRFCEFNTDGSSSMNEDRELNIALKKTAVWNRMSDIYQIRSFELFDSWVREFLNIYGTYDKKVDGPYVAIVDFLEKGSSMEEFNQFKLSFEKAGCEAEICEIRELKYRNKVLYSPSGHKIDAIYRRAVTSDIMHDREHVEDFLTAVREREVCLIGSFCTQIVHNKILFKLLHEKETQSFLNEEDLEFINAHIPYTGILNDDTIERLLVLSEKDNWIIKPEDSYGANGVYAGVNFSASEWRMLVEQNKNKDYLVQRFHRPYTTMNIDFHLPKPEFRSYSNLTGLYVYNEKFSGVYSRQSKKEIISTLYDENVIATIVLK